MVIKVREKGKFGMITIVLSSVRFLKNVKLDFGKLRVMKIEFLCVSRGIFIELCAGTRKESTIKGRQVK